MKSFPCGLASPMQTVVGFKCCYTHYLQFLNMNSTFTGCLTEYYISMPAPVLRNSTPNCHFIVIFCLHLSHIFMCVVTYDPLQKKAIDLAWCFLVDVLKLPKDQMYVTYFEGSEKYKIPADEETKQIWLDIGYVCACMLL